jgi:hypothetical protein
LRDDAGPAQWETVNESRDRLNIGSAHLKFRHASIGTAVLDDHGDGLTVLVVEHNLRTKQVWPALAATRIRTMAKTAVDTEQLLSSIDNRGICRLTNRIR